MCYCPSGSLEWLKAWKNLESAEKDIRVLERRLEKLPDREFFDDRTGKDIGDTKEGALQRKNLFLKYTEDLKKQKNALACFYATIARVEKVKRNSEDIVLRKIDENMLKGTSRWFCRMTSLRFTDLHKQAVYKQNWREIQLCKPGQELGIDAADSDNELGSDYKTAEQGTNLLSDLNMVATEADVREEETRKGNRQ